MLNRIRRAVSLARARRSPKGRHRRPLSRACSLARPAVVVPHDEPMLAFRQALERARYRRSLRGEDVALVRPCVLAWEQRGQEPARGAAGRQWPTEGPHPLLWRAG